MTDNDFPGGVEARAIQDRQTWLEWRLADVTASDVSCLFNAHPFRKTRLKLWAEKSGMLMEASDSPVMRRGRWGEAAVTAMLEDERAHWSVRRSKSLSARSRNPSRRDA